MSPVISPIGVWGLDVYYSSLSAAPLMPSWTLHQLIQKWTKRRGQDFGACQLNICGKFTIVSAVCGCPAWRLICIDWLTKGNVPQVVIRGPAVSGISIVASFFIPRGCCLLSLHTLSYLSQFARAAVRVEQVIVAPHNSSYRERMREGNLIYLMQTKLAALSWLCEDFLFKTS